VDTALTFSGGTIECALPRGGNPDSTLACQHGLNGVSFVLVGDSAGSLTISSAANFVSSNANPNAMPPDSGMINFGAQAANAYLPALNGVLFYGTGSGAVSIAGGTAAYLNGAIYFPNATVDYGNQMTMSPSCTVLIAKIINLNTTSQSSFAAGCEAYGTTMPQTQSASLGG
jgi:hypothetical protein